jgi:hypothetical protein
MYFLSAQWPIIIHSEDGRYYWSKQPALLRELLPCVSCTIPGTSTDHTVIPDMTVKVQRPDVPVAHTTTDAKIVVH